MQIRRIWYKTSKMRSYFDCFALPAPLHVAFRPPHPRWSPGFSRSPFFIPTSDFRIPTSDAHPEALVCQVCQVFSLHLKSAVPGEPSIFTRPPLDSLPFRSLHSEFRLPHSELELCHRFAQTHPSSTIRGTDRATAIHFSCFAVICNLEFSLLIFQSPARRLSFTSAFRLPPSFPYAKQKL